MTSRSKCTCGKCWDWPYTCVDVQPVKPKRKICTIAPAVVGASLGYIVCSIIMADARIWAWGDGIDAIVLRVAAIVWMVIFGIAGVVCWRGENE